MLELLQMGGRSLPEAIMMMIPEAWEQDGRMAAAKRDFYEYSSCTMEPWDGPAAIAFTDGRCIGAVLDRNGLRPGRYWLTHDDMVVLASETGVLAIDPARIKAKGRLQPGKMFLVDFAQRRLIPDEEIKSLVAHRHPYGHWLREQRLVLDDVVAAHLSSETRAQPAKVARVEPGDTASAEDAGRGAVAPRPSLLKRRAPSSVAGLWLHHRNVPVFLGANGPRAP